MNHSAVSLGLILRMSGSRLPKAPRGRTSRGWKTQALSEDGTASSPLRCQQSPSTVTHVPASDEGRAWQETESSEGAPLTRSVKGVECVQPHTAGLCGFT
jgi:hypothetical protein